MVIIVVINKKFGILMLQFNMCTEHSGLQVLHKVGAERAAAAVLTLDTPGANYRTVWALSKNFPHVKTFVRAHDVEHGLNLERAGATAVRYQTQESTIQLEIFMDAIHT